ncbi:hypothetical protein ACSQ67_002653 [Phaseolus vulgaris]
MPDQSSSGAMNDQLSNPTSIFGLRLWVVLGVCVGAAIVLILFLISVWVAFKRSKANPVSIPDVSKEIQEIRVDHAPITNPTHQPDPFPEPDPVPPTEEETNPLSYHRIQFEIGKNHRISYPERALLRSSSNDPSSAEARLLDQVPTVIPEVSHLGWGHWYTLRELEDSTNAFAPENVIGEGGYGIVYHGILNDNTHVAIKNLLNNRGQAEKEFKVEVEAIGRVRHKNLVRLLGYCAEGAHRMLVYEFVDNGNLEQWLHGDVGPYSPLTWEIRMNIILGTAKGYVAPEYASTGMLNERSDVYSFGILIMEVLTGRNPVDYSRPPEEVNLVDWLKKMVSNRNPEGVLDPKLPEKPTSRALKRALLVALRCTDPNAQKRPKMGHVIHMLEAEDSPYKEDRRARREAGHSPNDRVGDGLKEEAAVSVDDGKVENGMCVNETRTNPQIETQ